MTGRQLWELQWASAEIEVEGGGKGVYYANKYTYESSWTPPVEPVYDDEEAALVAQKKKIKMKTKTVVTLNPVRRLIIYERTYLRTYYLRTYVPDRWQRRGCSAGLQQATNSGATWIFPSFFPPLFRQDYRMSYRSLRMDVC
jgi:hypothetical protein